MDDIEELCFDVVEIDLDMWGREIDADAAYDTERERYWV